MDKNELVFTRHSRLRGCQRVLGIDKPTMEHIESIHILILRVLEWSELHSKFIIQSEHNYMDKLLFLELDENRVITIRPFSELNYKGAKGMRKVVNKKKEKY